MSLRRKQRTRNPITRGWKRLFKFRKEYANNTSRSAMANGRTRNPPRNLLRDGSQRDEKAI